jgi:hypothetical protein
MNDDIEQIRRAHASARPVTSNPAWMNCHHDCAVLLAEIDSLRLALAATVDELNATTELHRQLHGAHAEGYSQAYAEQMRAALLGIIKLRPMRQHDVLEIAHHALLPPP